MQSDCFAATAIAQLKLSESFDNGSDAILCDEFMECYHEHSALAALKVLEKEVCEKVERQQKGGL